MRVSARKSLQGPEKSRERVEPAHCDLITFESNLRFNRTVHLFPVRAKIWLIEKLCSRRNRVLYCTGWVRNAWIRCIDMQYYHGPQTFLGSTPRFDSSEFPFLTLTGAQGGPPPPRRDTKHWLRYRAAEKQPTGARLRNDLGVARSGPAC
jgi:hypothetical protein